ncbi:MAG TPA: ABC transporter substrate-binding protein [Polyangia bacterium]|nr:ABC transporter substrate-binding protein [Polyangia bacterium]
MKLRCDRSGLGVIFAVMGALLPNLSTTAWAKDKESIRIGWLSSLTGPQSTSAIAENKGVEFAVDEINRAGGINGRKLELVTRDTVSDPKTAVNFAKQLIFEEKVVLIIGPVNSGESLATIPVVAKEGIPNIIIGTVDELVDADKYPRAFRPINTNRQWIEAANDYALNVLRRKNVAILGDTTGYGASTAKAATSALEKQGIKPVYSALIDQNKTDLTDELNKARAAGADVIMPWSGNTGFMARIVNARGDMGWSVPIVGHPTVMAAPLRKLVNKPTYLDNTFAAGYSSMTYDDKGRLPATTKTLQEKIRPRLGDGEIAYSFWWVALGYDTVKLAEHAIRSAGGTDPAALQKALEDTRNFPGVYATYGYGPKERNGFSDKNIVINQANSFKDGVYRAAPR